MRDIKLLIFLLLFPAVAYTQVYYDAMEISEDLNVVNKVNIQSEKMISLLASYSNKHAGEKATLEDIVASFKDNPFIQVSDGDDDITKKVVFEYGTENIGNLEVKPRSFTSMIPSSNPLSVTTFADGLAKFLVRRSKQELNEAFFRKFQERIENSQARLDILFPSTHGTLTLIGTDIYRFNAFMETLRAGFIQDLKMLNQNTERWLLTDEVTKLFKTDKKHVLNITADIFHMSIMVQEGDQATDFFSYLSKEAHFINADWPEGHQVASEKFHSSIVLINGISDALRSRESERTWVGNDAIRGLKDNDAKLHLFLGLLYQKVKGIPFGEKRVGDFFTENNIGDFVDLFVEIYGYFKPLESLEGRMRKTSKQDKQQQYLLYGEYISRTFSLIDRNLGRVELLGGLSKEETEKARQYLKAAEDTNDMGLSLMKGEYGMAVLQLADFIQEHIDDENKVKPFLVKYGSFMAAMAKTENADQVASTIEAFALPSGSSTIKKYSEFNVSLNAFVGGYGGVEFLSKDNDWTTLESKGSMAFTSPVGVTCNWGTPSNRAYGIFVSLIDIGAITTFRFGDSDARLLPELSFKNIVAPGLYGMLHFGHDIPLSLAVGGQFGPNLRKIEPNGLPDIKAQGFRLGMTLAVDIPLMNIYTRPFEFNEKMHNLSSEELREIEILKVSEREQEKLKRLKSKYNDKKEHLEKKLDEVE